MGVVVLLLIILGVQKVDDLIEMNEKCLDRYLCQFLIINGYIMEERVVFQRIFNLSLDYILKLMMRIIYK